MNGLNLYAPDFEIMKGLDLYAPQVAKKIAEDNAAGVSKAELARRYQVSSRTIGRVIDRFLKESNDAAKEGASTVDTNEREKEIAALYAQGNITKAELARKFGVSPRTIGRIIERNTPHQAADGFDDYFSKTHVDSYVSKLESLMAPEDQTGIQRIATFHAEQPKPSDHDFWFSDDVKRLANVQTHALICQALVELISFTKKVDVIAHSGTYTTFIVSRLFNHVNFYCEKYGYLAESINPENPKSNDVSLLANNLVSYFGTRAFVNGISIDRSMHALYVLRFVKQELELQRIYRHLLKNGLAGLDELKELTAKEYETVITFFEDVCIENIVEFLREEESALETLSYALKIKIEDSLKDEFLNAIKNESYDLVAFDIINLFYEDKDGWAESDDNNLRYLLDVHLILMTNVASSFVKKSQDALTFSELIELIERTREKSNYFFSKQELVRMAFVKTVDASGTLSEDDLRAYYAVLKGLSFTSEESNELIEKWHPGCFDVKEKPYKYEVISSSRFVLISRQDAKTGEIETVTQNASSCTSTRSKFDDLLSKAESITGSDDPIIPELFTGLKEIVSAERQINNLAIVNGLIPSALRIDPLTGHVYYGRGNSPVVFSGVLVDRILKAVEDQDYGILKKLTRFTERLGNNPRKEIVSELYQFLEAGDIEIDDEGYVIAFKRVCKDFLDCYTRTFDNSPGKIVEVPRSSVDDDPKETCSYGLHVCSKAYLPHYRANGIVVKVKIDPEDFVSIPLDYYGHDSSGSVLAKARVCRYLVLSEEHDV